jgi:Helix-turn-helix domain
VTGSLRNEWRDAIRASELDASAKLVALVLATYANATGECWPSKQTLYEGCSLSARVVDRAVLRLEETGFVDVKRSVGRVVNRYFLRIPNPVPEAGVDPVPGSGVDHSQPRQQPRREPPPTPSEEQYEPEEPGNQLLHRKEGERQRTKAGEKRFANRSDGNGFIPDLWRYTGCRLARGSHSVQTVYDPLGTERTPPDWPYPRPTRAEIRAALDALEKP